MEIRVTKNDIFWSYTAQLLNIGVEIFILPIILKNYLQLNWEFDIFFSYSKFHCFIRSLPTIRRNISYVFSGVEELLDQGISEKKSNEINV